MNDYGYSTSLLALKVVGVKDFGSSNWILLSHHYFNIGLQDAIGWGAHFHVSLPIGLASLLRCLFQFLILLLIDLILFLWLNFKFLAYLYVSPLYLTCIYKYLSPICALSYYSLDYVFHRIEILNYTEVKLIKSFFLNHALDSAAKMCP